MRRYLWLLALGACSQPTPTAQKSPAVEAALAHVPGARVLEVQPARVLLAVPLASAPAESEGAPESRIVAYDVAHGSMTELLPRASWAANSSAGLLAVEDGALVLHAANGPRTILEHAAPDFAVDPTGRYVAAVIHRPELPLDTDLVLLPAIGGPARPLATFDGSSESRPIFTPDNRAVVFVSGRGGVASLWRVELAGGAPRQLTNVGLRSGQGARSSAFIPPPPDAASMHWEGETLVYAASGRTIRVDARGAR